jgi:hypothetical protein
MTVIDLMLGVMGVYAASGLVFGLFFVLRGVSDLDPVARGGTIGFRMLILPGAAALWPWLLLRWIAVRRGCCR